MNVAMSDEFVSFDQQAVIKVCGVGGGGGNAVNRMIAEGLKGVEFININTDAQALKHSPAPTRLQIGPGVTNGLGSGAQPGVGKKSAEEDKERIAEIIGGANMVFLTAGLGGGTGTGGSPIIAEIARSAGSLTVAIVTLPFAFEGPERMRNAMEGLEQLEPHVDTLIVIPNDRVAELSHQNVSFMDAFRQADEVLHNGVRAISELITVPGLVNLDFADVSYIMQARGRALMGIGRAEGENRAARAAEEAIVCPLLEQSSITGATSVIVNIKGGNDIGMREVQQAVSTVQKAAQPGANVIFGAVVEDEESPELQVTVIATGFPAAIQDWRTEVARYADPVVQPQAVTDEEKGELLDQPADVEAKDEPTPFEPIVDEPAPEPVSEAPAESAPKPFSSDDGEQQDLFGADAEDEDAAEAPADEEDDFDTPTWQRQNMPRWLQRRKKAQ